jgi:hypothetical protein
MKRKITKTLVMNSYYSDSELKAMAHSSVRATLLWLEKARLLFAKITPKTTKKLQAKLISEGW